MVVMVALRSGSLFRALRVLLKSSRKGFPLWVTSVKCLCLATDPVCGTVGTLCVGVWVCRCCRCLDEQNFKILRTVYIPRFMYSNNIAEDSSLNASSVLLGKIK